MRVCNSMYTYVFVTYVCIHIRVSVCVCVHILCMHDINEHKWYAEEHIYTYIEYICMYIYLRFISCVRMCVLIVKAARLGNSQEKIAEKNTTT